MVEESVTVFLRAQIGEFTGKMREAGAEVETLGVKGQSGFSKFQAVGTAALMAVGVAAIAVGSYGVKMADEYEKAHARLETAVHNTGGDFASLEPKIAAVSKKMEGWGFTNAEVESSIATLTTVTHSGEKAISLQSLAADIARARNVDLATATNALVKVEGGRYTALGRLLGLSKEQVAGIHNEHDAIQLLTNLVGGQASAYSETFAGKLQVLKAKGEDLAKNIGLVLIPQIERLVSIGLGAVQWLQHANDATGGWLGKITLFAAGGALAAVGILKIVSAARSAEDGLAKMVAKFVTVGADGRLAINSLGVAGIGAAIGLGVMTLGFSLAHSEEQRFNKEMQDAVKNMLAGGDAATRAGQQIASEFSPPVRELTQAYLDNVLAGKQHVLTTDQLREAILQAGNSSSWEAGKAEGLAKALHDQTDAMGAASKKSAELTAAQQAYADLLASGTASERELAQARRAVVDASGANAKVQNEVTAATEEGSKATDTNTTSTKKSTTALQDHAAALDKDRDAALSLIGADLSMDDALNTLGKDVADYNAKALIVIATHGKSAESNQALTDSTLQLRHGVDAVVQAAVADAHAQDAQRRARGQNIDSQREANDVTNATYTALVNMKAKYPELSAAIQTYIDKLNSIPPHVLTVVEIQQQLSGANVTAFQHPGGHAAGGTIGPGELGIVGEAGQELVRGEPGGGATVFTNAQTRKFLARPSGSAAGAPVLVHLEIPVHVEVAGTSSTADEIQAAVKQGVREGGAHVVDALLDFQRKGNGSVLAVLERG